MGGGLGKGKNGRRKMENKVADISTKQDEARKAC